MVAAVTNQGASAQPLSVSQAIGCAKETVDAMPSLLVTGEVSGFKGPARGGHCYFRLKDDSAAMDAIVWRGVHEHSGVKLRDGLQVLMSGHFQIYEPTGRLSFVARTLQASGEGLLRQQVAALAKRLKAEGLMDESRKRPIPSFCERVAVVTSPTGSVIFDVKRTLERRNPLVEVLVSGCSVQGEGAPQQIIRALARAAASRPDAILLVRGGGSYEDLMTFNDEQLARAIASCPVPVIAGIGHEDDVTIAEMVSDRRSSTPTAAAESVAPDFKEIEDKFHSREARLITAMDKMLTAENQLVSTLDARSSQAMRASIMRLGVQVNAYASRRCLQDPFATLHDREEQLVLSEQRLHDAAPRAARRLSHETVQLASRLVSVAPRIADVRPTEALGQRLVQCGPAMLRLPQAQLSRSAAQLDALSPLKVLGRGYAITKDEGGHVVSHVSQVAEGDGISVMLADGTVHARVTQTVADDQENATA